MKRTTLAIVVVLAVVAAGALGWWRFAARGVTTTREHVRGSGVTLDSTLWIPDGVDADHPAPAVLVAHGLGADRRSVRHMAATLAREGYVVRTWNARGVGDSTGRVGIAAPDGEVADVRALVDELATRPEVRRDATGDPRVGIVGVSHGGGVALLAGAADDRVDALVPIFAWDDLESALEPGRVLKLRWASELFAAGAGGGQDEREPAPCGRLEPDLCAAWTASAAANAFTPEATALLRERSLSGDPDGLDAPTLIVQGQMDSLFGFDQAIAMSRVLRHNHAPWRVEWVRAGHDLPLDRRRRQHVEDATLRWLDRYLRDRGDLDTGPRLTVELGAGRGYAHGPEVPPRSRALDLRLHAQDDEDDDGFVRLAAPAAGLPADATTLPGFGDVTGTDPGIAPPAGQRARFRTAEVDRGIELIGAPRVRLRVTGSSPDGILFVRFVDIAPDGRRIIPRGLVAPVRLGEVPPLGSAHPAEVEVQLPWIAWRLAPGHRAGIDVASTDAGYVAPPRPTTWAVAIAGDGDLQIPEVTEPRRTADTFDAGPDPRDLVVLAAILVLASIAAGIIISRWVGRRDGRVQEPHLRDTPIRAVELTKRFPDGRLAVDGVSFTVAPGTVVGLVGPNGAGKTTTIRMLLGLVRPTDGTAHVFGQRVRPGVPRLARIGALVEGPGLVPHLTGRQHLERSWTATGRRLADAHIDEALAAVGLERDAHRVVRTWSHGMRQRLGIAQALLGHPDLVLLDEPANGLDPAQIAQLRTLIREIAAGGRAVLLSSHLLGELEQVCTHVVLLAEGTVLEAGTLAQVVGEHEDLESAFLARVEHDREASGDA